MAQDVSHVLVTSLSTEGELLILWGQKDPNNANMLEEALHRHVSLNARTAPSDLSAIYPGLKCFAYNADGKFYRVRVKSVLTCLVQLHSIDFGFEFCVDFRSLRLAAPDDQFLALPDQAAPFYVANLVTSKPLNRSECSLLEQGLLYQQLTCKVLMISYEANVKVAVFYKGSLNVRDIWIQTGLVREIPLAQQEKMILMAHLGPSTMAPPVRSQPLPGMTRPPPLVSPILPPVPVLPPVQPTPIAKEELLKHHPDLIKAIAEEVKGQIGLSSEPSKGPHFPPPIVSIKRHT